MSRPVFPGPALPAAAEASEPAAAVQCTTARRAKTQLAAQLEAARRAQGLTKTELARRMGTSRSALDRLLDANDTRLTLATLSAVAVALGRHIDVRLLPESASDRSAVAVRTTVAGSGPEK